MTIQSSLARGASVALVAAVIVAAAGHRDAVAARAPVGGVHARLFHTHLIKSEPADNDTLSASPTAVKLWFTEDPELAVTSIKLLMPMGSDSMRLALSQVHRDAAAHSPVVADIKDHCAPGRYVIVWKTAAPDGHPAAGTITFVVSTRSASAQ